MDEFNKPIQPIGPKDREKIYVSPVEADKLDRDREAYKKFEEKKKNSVLAFFVVFFKKILTSIRKSESSTGTALLKKMGTLLCKT